MLQSINLRFGPDRNAKPISFSPGCVTLFVGPNNGGKTLALGEIEDCLQSVVEQRGTTRSSIIAGLKPAALTASDVGDLLEVTAAISSPVEGRALSIQKTSRRRPTHSALRLPSDAAEIAKDERAILGLIWATTLVLDGKTRLDAVKPAERDDFKGPAKSSLSVLLRDASSRQRLRTMVYDAFKRYLVVDPTGIAFRFCMSKRPPQNEDEELGIHPRSVNFYKEAADISRFSDGTQAFVGILASTVVPTSRVVLLDEPEAFLHPPLARQLGKNLSTLAADRSGMLFAATHSADFLMGCIQSGKPITVIRLTYEDDIASARMLEATRLSKLMRNALLRSTNLLGALFHRGAVVCEADADRALYQEVNERLQSDANRGAADTVFLNAQNWQTKHQLVRPLRSMGIPAAAIIDLDVLGCKSTEWKSLLSATGVPTERITGLGDTRARLEKAFEPLGKPKEVGIAALPPDSRDAAESFLTDLARHGIFVVPVGELEGWLADLKLPKHGGNKPAWLVSAFERMGDDATAATYVRPPAPKVQQGNLSHGPKWASLDVWGFVEQVAQWLADPERAGMRVTAADEQGR